MSALHKIKYTELVNVPQLQALMESFSQVLGIANAVIDIEGVVITRAGWQSACTEFHRVNSETCKRCIQSDTSLVESMTRGAPFAVYRCHNGLVDTAAPILVGGEHVANVFTGQFLTAAPDLEFFRRQARQFGFDEARYMAAIEALPILDQTRVESLTHLYAQLAGVLGEGGLDRLKQQQALAELSQLNVELEERVDLRTRQLEKRLTVLTQPMEGDEPLTFEDLFDLDEIQGIQDEFALATGVASIITHVDGTPITAPSNFTALCSGIIRKTERGCANCFKSDAAIGRYHPNAPIVQPCLSGGLWDAGTSIIVGGHHVANWLIGQVRDETQTEEGMLGYARAIGADEEQFIVAFRQVPSMSRVRFEQVAKALFTFANQLSTTAFHNVMQARNIAERKRTEEVLRQSEETFKKLFTDSADASLLIDSTGVFVECNQAALNLLKMSREQFLFLPPSRISPEWQPDGRRSDESAQEKIALAYSKGLHRFEWTHLNAEGGEFIVEVSLMPIVIKGQSMLHTAWRDITERIRNEHNFRNAMMFMPIPIGIANSAGAIVFFNEAFSATYGYVVGDFPNIDDWCSGVYPDPVYRAEMSAIWGADVAVAVKSGQVTPRREYRIVSKNGETKRVIISMRPIGEQFVTAFEDITQSKLNEEELAQHRLHLENLVAKRTRELDEKNQALENALLQLRQAQDHLVQESKLSSLGELVAGIAHELNTPIGNARTVSTTLFDQGEDFVHRLDGGGNIKKSEFLGFLRQVSEGTRLLEHNLIRAADLIQSFKQVAVDRASSQRRTFNLRTVTEEVILTLLPSFKKTPFVIENNIEPDIDLEGYPGALGQILVNLIDNALIHGLEGRAQGRILMTGQKVGETAEIEISDNGGGISKENIPRIFDPFFTTRMGQGGSGLGLNIVFNIVNGLLGGKITVTSVSGEGATFKITLPLLAPNQSDDESIIKVMK